VCVHHLITQFINVAICFSAVQFEIKAFLESVHGMQVERVSTINYQGKKQRIIDDKGRPHYR
jgi:ribosomal protein L23